MSEDVGYVPCCIKLVSGEEIFASLESMDPDGNVSLTKVYKIMRMFVNGVKGIESKLLYEPWMDYCEGEVHIMRQNIILCEPLKPRLVELYMEMLVNLTNTIPKDGDDVKIRGEKPLVPKRDTIH